MLSRRSFTYAGLLAPALAVLAPKLFSQTTVLEQASGDNDQQCDREVELSLSSALRQQQWTYAGQRYRQINDEIVVNEEESIRFHLMNDTAEPRHLAVQGLHLKQMSLQRSSAGLLGSKDYPGFALLAAGTSITMDANIKSLATAKLIDLEGGVQRTIRVRPCDQFHPFV
jgi:hypothetical protein